MHTLIFVYNADAGLLNEVMDSLHKFIFPETYSCKLCALTSGYFNMKKEWKKFTDALPYKKEFLHKDEFHKKYGDVFQLPAIVLKRNSELSVLLSADDFKKMNSLAVLIAELKKKLQVIDPAVPSAS